MEGELDKRLEDLALDQPRLAGFAHKMIDVLETIRRDFQGEMRDQLEEMVGDTVERQLNIAENARRSEQALADLRETHDELIASLYEVVLRLVPDGGATRH